MVAAASPSARRASPRRQLEQVECDAGVAVGVPGDGVERLSVAPTRHVPSPCAASLSARPRIATTSSASAARARRPSTREQRRVHFERRVLGRRPHEDDVARLDTREEGVLLCLVEAVISSTNRMVRQPRRRRASCASAMTALMSLMRRARR